MVLAFIGFLFVRRCRKLHKVIPPVDISKSFKLNGLIFFINISNDSLVLTKVLSGEKVGFFSYIGRRLVWKCRSNVTPICQQKSLIGSEISIECLMKEKSKCSKSWRFCKYFVIFKFFILNSGLQLTEVMLGTIRETAVSANSLFIEFNFLDQLLRQGNLKTQLV